MGLLQPPASANSTRPGAHPVGAGVGLRRSRDDRITGIVNLVLFVCLVVYLTRLRATLTRSAEAQERIAAALERQVGE